LGIGCNGYYSVGINARSVVNGVTLVLVVVGCDGCLTYHLSMRSMPLQHCLRQQLPMDHHHLLDCLLAMAVAVSQFAGLTFNPVDGLASHNGR
jgi:hypothetical protein